MDIRHLGKPSLKENSWDKNSQNGDTPPPHTPFVKNFLKFRYFLMMASLIGGSDILEISALCAIKALIIIIIIIAHDGDNDDEMSWQFG